MATETQIANYALVEIGQALITDIDADTPATREVCYIYDQKRDELLAAGPEKGWKFARHTYHGIDVDSVAFTAVADGGSSTMVLSCSSAPTVIAGDMVNIDGDVYDGDYDVTSVSTTAPYTITVSGTYSATDSGTAYWTSEEYDYRYAIPSGCLRIVDVLVDGDGLTDWIKRGSYILTNQEDEEVDIKYVKQITDSTVFPAHFIRYLALAIALALGRRVVGEDYKLIQKLEMDLERARINAIAHDEQEKYNEDENNDLQEAGH